MNISRKIAEGVAGWLMYEFHSFRGQLFSEKYLTTPIGNILSGIYRDRIVAEYSHVILNEHRRGAGRPPQIDFVIKENDHIKIAVESKWIGKSQIGVGDIIWDMIRLELLAQRFNAECYFVLAGSKRMLQELFESDRFLEKRSDGRTRPVLRIHKHIIKSSIRLDSPPAARAMLIKDRLNQYCNISMPGVIRSSYPEHYPKECRNTDFQVYVWEIYPSKTAQRFFPRNNVSYSD